MNYLEESLKDIAGISVHFSSDCNMACKYCYIDKDKKCMAAYNREIRQALEDGSFAKVIIEKCGSQVDMIENISLWGAEPTINSKLFQNFIYELLDFFKNTDTLMFSTNALLGGELIYNDFLIPLQNYAHDTQRHIKFQLQLSLDGPPEFNDDSRHVGATNNTLNAMRYILSRMPDQDEYFSLEISTKTTLDIHYMRLLLAGGVEKMQWYYNFFDDVLGEALELIKGKSTVTCFISSPPTLVDPGYHTVQDGKDFAAWIHLLQFVDKTQFKHLHGPLIWQPLSGVEAMLACPNPVAEGMHFASCSSSKNNISIDHNGNLYTCNRLCRNAAMPEDPYQIKHAMQSNTNFNINDKTWLKRTYGSFAFHDNLLSRWYIQQGEIITLAACGQIQEKYLHNEDEQKLLFMSLIGLSCHIGAEEDYTQNPFLFPYSYFRYLGNGAVDELLNYYKLEILRGEVQPWRIVT